MSEKQKIPIPYPIPKERTQTTLRNFRLADSYKDALIQEYQGDWNKEDFDRNRVELFYEEDVFKIAKEIKEAIKGSFDYPFAGRRAIQEVKSTPLHSSKDVLESHEKMQKIKSGLWSVYPTLAKSSSRMYSRSIFYNSLIFQVAPCKYTGEKGRQIFFNYNIIVPNGIVFHVKEDWIDVRVRIKYWIKMVNRKDPITGLSRQGISKKGAVEKFVRIKLGESTIVTDQVFNCDVSECLYETFRLLALMESSIYLHDDKGDLTTPEAVIDSVKHRVGLRSGVLKEALKRVSHKVYPSDLSFHP